MDEMIYEVAHDTSGEEETYQVLWKGLTLTREFTETQAREANAATVQDALQAFPIGWDDRLGFVEDEKPQSN